MWHSKATHPLMFSTRTVKILCYKNSTRANKLILHKINKNRLKNRLTNEYKYKLKKKKGEKYMLDPSMNLANGYMEQIQNQKLQHPEWPVDTFYLYKNGRVIFDAGMPPIQIVRMFIRNQDINLIRAMSDKEIRKVNRTSLLDYSNGIRIIKNVYNVCKSGLEQDDIMQYQFVGNYECLQFWHPSKNGKPGFKMEAIYYNPTQELYVCMKGD